MKKQRLELTWIGKDQQNLLEPRILIEDPEKSYGDKNSPNMLIKGDNLLALKALEQDYAGKVKCIFIDPPYNTGSAFEHYDDGIEHSLWLSLIRERLEILKRLLDQDGSIWISIDDNEGHYLKVLCDEIFGRKNFVTSIVWRSTDNSNNDAKQFSVDHNYILVYSKNPNWITNKLAASEKRGHFKNPDNDPRGPWFDGNPLNSPAPRPNLMFELVAPNGNIIQPPKNGWRWGKETLLEKIQTGEIRFNENNTGIRRRTYLADMKGLPPSTLWADLEETGHNRQAKYELKNLFPERTTNEVFSTPKPEKLLKRILDIATMPGDTVLDSFLGSGTTAAVSHKMKRHWIGVELGEHCDTHCLPRLKKVVDGQDLGGVTEISEWNGGGGFRYYLLAPSLLKEDKYGNWVIDPRYNANMLAAAMAKHENFRYSPDEVTFWKQGQSTEKDFIFTTTNFLTVEFLDRIHDEMQEDESLLICCKSFQDACFDRHSNITVKKIPQMLLGRCEFGREDYSLHIITVPSSEDPSDEPALPTKPKPKRRAKANQQESFLDDLVGEDA